MAIILHWAKKMNTDNDISNKEDRFIPLIVGVLSYSIGFLISLILGLSNFLTALILCYTVNTFIVMLITTRWKISIHTTGLSGPVAALIMLLGQVGAIFGLLYPILIWSRTTLKKHTMAQAIAGGAFGFIMTILEMYLYMNILNLAIYNLVPLNECLWITLALIGTPIVLGIVGILNDYGLADAYTRKMFHFLGFSAFGFFTLFAPKSALITLILAGPLAILITCYGGKNYSWFRGIKRNSDSPNETLYIILPLISSVIWLICSWPFFSREIILISTFVVALADAIAEPIGAKFGNHKYKIKSLKGDKTYRSIEGSSSVLAVATIILFLFTHNLIISLLIGIVVSIVEAISPRGTDNLTIPVICAILLRILL
ncbi:diacylglycerol/polyprenol kinase family protein [Methanobrevibacter olleyae]|uniref:Dolichol kinase n=1 Tax=Methanobrevibacter olleyae TaxID=294671 RepID=A0A126QZW7_METOL|nr:hypothetical protein [Methanobrevibacter olleyae]AMK14925.1 hypothetical protein YLM1_0365 [Methanobrevibacter olleyae]